MNTKVNATFKDTLFRFLFDNAKELLNLYNAVCGTEYKDETELEITTLRDVVYIGIKNDISFILDLTMNLFEHQSTENPNMPLRGILYFGQLFQKYVETTGANLYGNKRIPLPTPRYIIFCNYPNMKEDYKEYRLSDAFQMKEIERVSLECIAEVININAGHNEEIMKKCKKLKEYAQFVEEVRNWLTREKEVATAIDNAINHCIGNGILADILRIHKAEVSNMLLEEYDAEKHIAMERRDAKAEGKAEGIIELLEDLGEVSNTLRSKIMEQTEVEVLRRWLKSAASAEDVEDFIKKM